MFLATDVCVIYTPCFVLLWRDMIWNLDDTLLFRTHINVYNKEMVSILINPKKKLNINLNFYFKLIYSINTYFTNSTRVYNWVEVPPVPQIIADLHFRFKNTPKETVREQRTIDHSCMFFFWIVLFFRCIGCVRMIYFLLNPIITLPQNFTNMDYSPWYSRSHVWSIKIY